MTGIPSKTDVVIIGAGVAGLAAARRLSIAGREVCVIDASDEIGGRIRTDQVDGLLLDRGFQLYNPSYSEGISVLDLKALDVKSFSPGVIVSIDGRNYKMADPKREPSWAIDSLLAPVGKMSSKVKFAKYAILLALAKTGSKTYDQRTDAFLQAKFGRDLTDKVLRPFVKYSHRIDLAHIYNNLHNFLRHSDSLLILLSRIFAISYRSISLQSKFNDCIT